jgi:hypothetical protein
VRQLELVRRDDPRRPDSLSPQLDEKTLRELVAVMAEAILAVLRSRTEADDER